MQIIWLGSIWFKVTQLIALTWGSWGCRKVTFIPSPLKWSPQASLGAFPFAVWKNWRGGDSWIHSTAQRKEHSKTEFEKNKFEESETFYRSKISRATGVIDLLRFIAILRFLAIFFSEIKLRRSQDRFVRQKIERFFWRDFSGEELLPENSFLGQ